MSATVSANFTDPLSADRIDAELRRAQRAAEVNRIVFAYQSGTKPWRIAKEVGVKERFVLTTITRERRAGRIA